MNNDEAATSAVVSSSPDGSTSVELDGVDGMKQELYDSGLLLGSPDDITVVVDAITDTNILLVVVIAVILAFGFVRALLGWCYRG